MRRLIIPSPSCLIAFNNCPFDDEENKTLQRKAKGVGDTYFSTFFLALEPLPSNLDVSL